MQIYKKTNNSQKSEKLFYFLKLFFLSTLIKTNHDAQKACKWAVTR